MNWVDLAALALIGVSCLVAFTRGLVREVLGIGVWAGASAAAVTGIRARTGVEIDVDEYLASPQVFIGSVDGLVAKLTELRERLGITSFMLGDVDTLAPVVERLSGT